MDDYKWFKRKMSDIGYDDKTIKLYWRDYKDVLDVNVSTKFTFYKQHTKQGG